MLREHSDIDRHSHWSDVKRKVDADPRYKAVDSHGMREDWFREYCKILKEEKRRRKEERERERNKDKHRKKDKDRKVIIELNNNYFNIMFDNVIWFIGTSRQR